MPRQTIVCFKALGPSCCYQAACSFPLSKSSKCSKSSPVSADDHTAEEIVQQISGNQFHHNPALPCFSYLLIPSFLLHLVMEDSCVCFGIRSLSSFFLAQQLVMYFCFFFCTSFLLCIQSAASALLESLAQLGSAWLGDSSGEWTQKTALMGELRA